MRQRRRLQGRSLPALPQDVTDLVFGKGFMEDFFDDVERFMHGRMSSLFPPEESCHPVYGSYPKLNIINLKDRAVVEAAVPGMTKEDVTIDIKDGVMVISGKAHQDSEVEKDNYISREIKRSAFQRTIGNVDESLFDLTRVSAKMENGILTITLPKIEVVDQKEEPTTTKVEIL